MKELFQYYHPTSAKWFSTPPALSVQSEPCGLVSVHAPYVDRSNSSPGISIKKEHDENESPFHLNSNPAPSLPPRFYKTHQPFEPMNVSYAAFYARLEQENSRLVGESIKLREDLMVKDRLLATLFVYGRDMRIAVDDLQTQHAADQLYLNTTLANLRALLASVPVAPGFDDLIHRLQEDISMLDLAVTRQDDVERLSTSLA